MTAIRILKMDGTGNDFVIADLRENEQSLTTSQIVGLSERTNSETNGCDQLIVLKNTDEADVFMHIFNSDGSKSSSCGNASRCVASIIMKESGATNCKIATDERILHCYKLRSEIEVNMGKPKLEWNEIPVSRECDTLDMNVGFGSLHHPVGVSMGNPHAVYFVKGIKDINLKEMAVNIQKDPFFPEGVNVGIAEIVDKENITLRVYERGAGETQACGTGACAALVAANRRGLSGREAKVKVNGGVLNIRWAKDGDVWMTGNANLHFDKILDV